MHVCFDVFLTNSIDRHYNSIDVRQKALVLFSVLIACLCTSMFLFIFQTCKLSGPSFELHANFENGEHCHCLSGFFCSFQYEIFQNTFYDVRGFYCLNELLSFVLAALGLDILVDLNSSSYSKFIPLFGVLNSTLPRIFLLPFFGFLNARDLFTVFPDFLPLMGVRLILRLLLYLFICLHFVILD